MNSVEEYNEVDYTKCSIVNIRRGAADKGRDHILYAKLVDENGDLVISATLDYITQAMHERIPGKAKRF
jgi:hypothetical protein